MKANTTSKINIFENPKIKNRIMRYLSFSGIFVLVVVFTLLDSRFLNQANIRNLLSDTAPIMIMAAGTTFILLMGSIDLSVGAVCSVANVMSVKLLMDLSEKFGNMYLAGIVSVFATLIYGILAGFILGNIQSRLKIPSFIASLGLMSTWKSVALLITKSPVPIPRELTPVIGWEKITIGLIGLPLILAIIIVILFYILQERSVFGKSVVAIGGNERAARLSGINILRNKIIAFTLNGLCAALGGIFLAAKLKSSAPTVGDSFTLLIIASVVLGGTALSGGKGSVLGTILGVLITSIIRNGLNIIGVDVFWQNIVFGLVVLAAVSITVDRSNRNLIIK